MAGIRKVHPDTARAARKIAREELGIQEPKLRPATHAEQLQAFKKSGFDLQQIRDAVVVEDKKNGREFLLGIDLDPAKSRHLNAESGVLTWGGMIPVIGAPVVASFAIKDIVKGGMPALKAKMQGEATNPADRALLRMGLKHLGLSGLAMATNGLSHVGHAANAADAALLTGEAASHAVETAHGAKNALDIATIAHNVHLGLLGVETAVGAKDISDAREPGTGVKGVAKAIGAGISGILKSLVAGLQGLAGVHHPEEHHKEDARLIFAKERKLGGGELVFEELGEKKAGHRQPPATGPPS